MPTASAQIFRVHNFQHKGTKYDVHAFVEPLDPFMFRVEVTNGGQPVVITYPDKSQAVLGYSVTVATRIDLANTNGIDAISYLMKTAETDIKNLI